jgi:hypothetical protein
MVSFTLRPFYLWEKCPSYPFNIRLAGLQNRSWMFWRTKSLLSLARNGITIPWLPRPYPSHWTDYTTLAPLTCLNEGDSGSGGDDNDDNNDEFRRLIHYFKFCIYEYKTNGLGRWENLYLLVSNLRVNKYVYNQKYPSPPAETANCEF